MSQSGLSSLKRTWSGNNAELDAVEVAPLHSAKSRNGSSGSHSICSASSNATVQAKVPLAEVDSNSTLGSAVDSAINLSTPSPEKPQARVEDPAMKRKLPDSFHYTDPGRGKMQFKSALQLKADGAKSSLFKPGTTSSAASTSAGALGAAKTKVNKLFLSKEQRAVLDMAVQGKNLFFTGSAGTGKSVVLREIIKELRHKFTNKLDAVAVTASTGIAACNIGGVTLHSFAGCGLGIESAEDLIRKIKKQRKAVSRWMRTSSLIVDEVSMVDPDFLDKLNKIGQFLRKSPKPFGGIQIIMTGDFFQLPPVNKNSRVTRYAFDANCWDEVIEQKVCLTQVFRQKDAEFVNMLNEMRFGSLSPASIRVFQSLTGESELEKSSKMPATALYPLRQEVEKANAQHLVKILQPSHTFDSTDAGTMQGDQRIKMLENFMAPAKLRLKVQCQVMLIKNLDEQLVNGSIGTVLAFLAVKDFNKAQYGGIDWEDVHPESMTEEEVMNLVNEKYWAASNGSSGAKDESPTDEKAAKMMEYHEKIVKEDKKEKIARSRSASPEKFVDNTPKFPVVRFLTSNGRFRTIHVLPEVWKNEQPNGEVLVSRTQVPLILAWAMSIHKSQGQTIPIVKIDLGKVFEKGQAYVALSRAVSKEGLQVLNFNPQKVMADPRVTKWYKDLPTVS